MKATFALVGLALLVSACSSEDVALEARAVEPSDVLSENAAPETTVPVSETTTTSTGPVEDVQPWPIGPMYRVVSLRPTPPSTPNEYP